MKTKTFILTTLAVMIMLDMQAQWQTDGNNIFYNSGSVGICIGGGGLWSSALNIGPGSSTWGSQIVFRSELLAGGVTYQISTTACNAGEGPGKFLIRNNNADAELTLDSIGYFGIGTQAPSARLQVSNGDIYIDNINNGIIMKSPNGQCWRGKLDNTGDLKFSQIDCPIPDTAQSISVTKGIKITNHIVVYPNPIDNIITIGIENYKNELLTAIITNSSGQIINKKLISTNVTTMNTSNMMKGIYILSIEDRNGNSVSSNKIIKE
jgi:hypothetical protein